MGKAELVTAEQRSKTFEDQIRGFSQKNAEAKGDKSTTVQRERRLPPRCLHPLGGGNLDSDWMLYSVDGGDRSEAELLDPETWVLASSFRDDRQLKPRDEVICKTRPTDKGWLRINLEVVGISNRRPLFHVWGSTEVERKGDATITRFGPDVEMHAIGHVFELFKAGSPAGRFNKFEDARKQAETLARKT